MQIIKDIEQGSNEWLALRLGLPTCSDLSKIVTSTGEISKQLNDYAKDLASDMLLDQIEEGFKSQWMDRGNDLEDEARKAYEEYSFNVVEQVSFIKHSEKLGYSPDGWIGEDGLIEIKCPKKIHHFDYLINKKLPTKYKPQVQGALFASGRKWCDFISYNPNVRKPYDLFVVRVFPDKDYFKSLDIALDKVIEKRDYYLNKV